MVFLGFGKYARADKVYALKAIVGDERGGGRGGTHVWVEGVDGPLVASRTERIILHDMGHEAGDSRILDEALDLAERLAAAAEEGRVDLGDLGRQARRLLGVDGEPTESSRCSEPPRARSSSATCETSRALSWARRSRRRSGGA